MVRIPPIDPTQFAAFSGTIRTEPRKAVNIPFPIIRYPGTELNTPGADIDNAMGLLNLAENRLFEAYLALVDYSTLTSAKRPSDIASRIKRGELLDEALSNSQYDGDLDQPAAQRIITDLDIRLLREQFQGGALPLTLQTRRDFVFARAFLHSLDSIMGVFIQLKQKRFELISSHSEAAENNMDSALPGLRQLRNADAHVDERVQGLSNGKKITPAYGGYVTETLNNDVLCSTSGSGAFVTLEISEATLMAVSDCFQSFIDKLPWKGIWRISPRLD